MVGLMGIPALAFDFKLVWETLPTLLAGAGVTLQLTAAGVGIGLVLGTLLGICRTSPYRVLSVPASIYVEFVRGTPLLVQIFIIYMGVPAVLSISFDRMVAAIAALGLNSGAYVAEIVRAGIQGVDMGQVEAARSLGMSGSQTMRYIVLPQAFRKVIPPLVNEFIALLKDSSLVAVISLEELFRKAQLVQARTFRPFEMYFSVAIIYLAMTLSLSALARYLERRLDLARRGREVAEQGVPPVDVEPSSVATSSI